MKKTSSLVWRFFDRLEENKRCVAVLCKLCDSQYKYFGNTTNLRTHLVNKHPIQWELLQNGTLDESTYRAYEDDENTNQSSVTPKRRKYVKVYKNENVGYSVSVDLNKKQSSGKSADDGSMPIIEIQRVDALEHSETDIEQGNNEEATDTINIHQMHENRPSDEEWLEDDWTHVETYGPQHKKLKYRQIKREVTSPTPPKRLTGYVFNQKPTITKTQVQPRLVSMEPIAKKDEFTVFGEYIGNKLRKFKSYQTSVNVQQLITTILWQAEYGVYDNMESVKRIVLSTVQEMDTTQNLNHVVQVQTQDIIIEEKEEMSQSGTDCVTLVEA